MTSTIDTARRAMPPMERLAAGYFINEAEHLAYERGWLVGHYAGRAKATP